MSIDRIALELNASGVYRTGGPNGAAGGSGFPAGDGLVFGEGSITHPESHKNVLTKGEHSKYMLRPIVWVTYY